MPMAAMARREQELGYPSSHPRSPSDVGFTLPSINDVGLLHPGAQTPTENGDMSAKTNAMSLPKFGNGREIVSPESTECPTSTSISIKDGKRPERDSVDQFHRDVNAQRSDTTPPTPSPPLPSLTILPVKPPTPSLRLFSTWLPDDSLPFIQTRLLSNAEKVTLERRMSETKSPPAPIPTHLPEVHVVSPTPEHRSTTPSKLTSTPPSTQHSKPQSYSSSQTQKHGHSSGRRQSQSQQHPSSPTTEPMSLTRHLPKPKNLENPPPPSHSSSHTLTQGPPPYLPPYVSSLSSLSLRRPSQLRRAHTTDLELLRQVKSNNLTLPSATPSGPAMSVDTHREPQTPYGTSPFIRIPLHQRLSHLRTPQHHPPGLAYDPRHHIPMGPIPHTQDRYHHQHQYEYQSRTLHPPPPSHTNEAHKGKKIFEPVSPRSIHPSREPYSATSQSQSHGPSQSQSWPRSESRPIGGEEGRVGHPYSRESGVSRVRGGHGFRHQR